jgi:hypothetical protein
MLATIPFRNISSSHPSSKNLTPWSRLLLEKLIVIQLVKKFPAFYRTLKFITVFTWAHHWYYPKT